MINAGNRYSFLKTCQNYSKKLPFYNQIKDSYQFNFIIKYPSSLIHSSKLEIDVVLKIFMIFHARILTPWQRNFEVRGYWLKPDICNTFIRWQRDRTISAYSC